MAQDILCNKHNTTLPTSFLEATPHKRGPKKGARTVGYADQDFSELPPELQMQFIEEDMACDEIPPDEQQLEVLEDIWLKAGEIGKIF